MEELAPAKVNLFLRVLGRQDDSFHEIETLMTRITLYDSLEIERAEAFEFQSSDPMLPPGGDNLVVRAALLFFSAAERKPNVRITLQKKIPYGAGLGGGSSDAAATLRLLGRFFEIKLSPKKLAGLAAELGSDVSFFLGETAAICRGRGEIVESVQLPGQLNLVLLKPPFGVPTPWAYSRFRQAQEIPGVTYQSQKIGQQIFVNDLERPVFEKFVFLARLKTWLLEQDEVSVALMAGSGSTVFAVVPEQASAEALITRARKELDPNLWACFCQTLEGAALSAP
jgi:4-diphosphocytidyl-2-C-methyl-D-erythritol kinase